MHDRQYGSSWSCRSSELVQANAQKVQLRLVNPHSTSAQQAADVVERVILTEGEDYLETQQHTLWWWQLAMLDVKVFLGLGAFATCSLLSLILFIIARSALSLVRYGIGSKPQRSRSWKRKAV